jgi:hypothetical protein
MFKILIQRFIVWIIDLIKSMPLNTDNGYMLVRGEQNN